MVDGAALPGGRHVVDLCRHGQSALGRARRPPVEPAAAHLDLVRRDDDAGYDGQAAEARLAEGARLALRLSGGRGEEGGGEDEEGAHACHARTLKEFPSPTRPFGSLGPPRLPLVARLYWPGMDPAVQREALEIFAAEVIPALR